MTRTNKNLTAANIWTAGNIETKEEKSVTEKKDNDLLTEIFGPVISSYSRQDAINDGMLIDLNQFIPQNESGFAYPVACTAAVYAIMEKAVNNEKYCNDYAGITWDIFTMARLYMKANPDNSQILFKVIITGAGRKKNHVFKIVCGPDDNMAPCLTIMMPNED